ncbi:MAG: hypothetical protein JO164_02490 [Candidatus Eremiobacteraeota bacterium]|nr:hypothetical protein [Candidatus Eremiobacteraeota bacterium]
MIRIAPLNERLSAFPLEVRGARQFPLKGKHNKPFWEYEITGGDRLYYAVDRRAKVVVVAVLPQATRSDAMTRTVRDRRDTFDALVATQESEKQQIGKTIAVKGKARGK